MVTEGIVAKSRVQRARVDVTAGSHTVSCLLLRVGKLKSAPPSSGNHYTFVHNHHFCYIPDEALHVKISIIVLYLSIPSCPTLASKRHSYHMVSLHAGESLIKAVKHDCNAVRLVV